MSRLGVFDAAQLQLGGYRYSLITLTRPPNPPSAIYNAKITKFVCSQGSAPLEDKDHVRVREFDAAVSNTPLMDIPCITPLLRAVRRSLKAGSRLGFLLSASLLQFERDHGLWGSATQDDGSVTFSVQVSQYRSLTSLKGIGIAGQPQPHHYFHHPIHVVGGSFGRT